MNNGCIGEPTHRFARTTDGKKRGERWFDVLRRWLVQCPQCSEVRLVVGAHENDQYVCKDCGHSFSITFSAVTREHG